MASTSRLSHHERTAAEPREAEIHRVTLHDHENVNEDIRIVRLRVPDGRNVEARLSSVHPGSTTSFQIAFGLRL